MLHKLDFDESNQKLKGKHGDDDFVIPGLKLNSNKTSPGTNLLHVSNIDPHGISNRKQVCETDYSISENHLTSSYSSSRNPLTVSTINGNLANMDFLDVVHNSTVSYFATMKKSHSDNKVYMIQFLN